MAATCCGIDEAIEYLTEHDASDMAFRIINRLAYIRDKDVGVKPKFHKGKYGKMYDSYTCGNCGHTILQIGFNFCTQCGYRILWDGCRCLTK